jgi:hypothetical protein
MSRAVHGVLASCVVLLIAACPPRRVDQVGDQTDTCSDKSSSLPSESELSFGFCTVADCPLAPEDQGDVVARFCARTLQPTCTPCHCPEPGIVSTSPEPRCKAEEGNNPRTTKYVTGCEFERGNVENPVVGCTAELPSKCTCAIRVPRGETLRCRCSCPPVPV